MSLTSCHFCANYSPSDPCSAPLGMQDKRITDAHLTSSSMHDRHHGPWRARLQQRNSGGRGAWSARHNNRKQWIQVNLGTITRVKGVATQGRYEANQWVTSYKVSYSVNGLKFYSYREGRKVKVRTRTVASQLVWLCLSVFLTHTLLSVFLFSVFRCGVCFKYLLLAECEVRTASYGPNFFLPFMKRESIHRIHKAWSEHGVEALRTGV